MRRPAVFSSAARGDKPAGEAGLRPDGLYGADRGGRRQRAVRHVLLSVLCARDFRSARLEALGDQQCETGQHPRRIRLSADAGIDGSVRGRGRQRQVGADMSARVFKARHAMGLTVRGPALVAHDGFSARYDLDRIKGVFSRPAHKLAGQSYVGRILVLDTAKGGVATAWMLHEMKSRGIVPLAIVLNSVNPILAQGAALGDLPMLAGFDEDITAAIPNGAEVEINPQMKLLTVVKGRGAS